MPVPRGIPPWGVGGAVRGHYSPVMVIRLCAISQIGRRVVSGKVVELGSASQLRHCLRVGRYAGGTCRSAQPAFPCHSFSVARKAPADRPAVRAPQP